MKKYNPGEIVEVAFPYEEDDREKVRPALVIKDYGDELLLLKITSQHKGRKWDIEIPAEPFNGLTKNSVIQADRYAKIPKSSLTTVIPRGVVNPIQLEIVKQKLKDYIKTQR